jgi:hypothetical protein
MSATVARTRPFRPEATARRFAVRVTHTLLFLAAAAVPPGVCDACPACPTRAERSDSPDGSQDRPAGSRQQGVAAAVAASHCCGPRASTVPCMPTGRSPADRMPPRGVADAGDGAPSSCGDGCTCLLESRDRQTDAIAEGSAGAGDLAATIPAVAWPPIATEPMGMRTARLAEIPPPGRPVRVLYGVWRN